LIRTILSILPRELGASREKSAGSFLPVDHRCGSPVARIREARQQRPAVSRNDIVACAAPHGGPPLLVASDLPLILKARATSVAATIRWPGYFFTTL
jgi:hypothetical protein